MMARTLKRWNDLRTVDTTGLVWQQGAHREVIVGEVHSTRSGNRYVVMCGKRITPARTTLTWDQACDLALGWEPTDPTSQEVLTTLLG